MHKSVYDESGFFELYQKLRQNPQSLNEVVEKPTMLGLLPDLNGKKLLDLGCGTGEHLSLYLQRGAREVIGVDLSASMLKQAEENLSKLKKTTPHFSAKFRLYQQSMDNLEILSENDFDIITSSFAFHYIADFPALLEQIKQKLKPNGTLIFSQEHPIVTAFQGNEISGERWQKDEYKTPLAYRLNFYRDEGERSRLWFQKPFKTYHRTVSTIINNLINTSFIIEQMEEPMLTDQPQWHNEFKDLQHRPVLLFLKARKI